MPIDWESLRRDFERGDVSIRALARKYGCHESTIREKAKKKKWAADERLSFKRREPKPEELIEEHKALWGGVKRRLAKGLEAQDPKTGIEELKFAKAASDVLSNVMKGERLAWGLSDRVEEPLDDIEEITREMASLTAPPGAGEALEGE